MEVFFVVLVLVLCVAAVLFWIRAQVLAAAFVKTFLPPGGLYTKVWLFSHPLVNDPVKQMTWEFRVGAVALLVFDMIAVFTFIESIRNQ